MFLNVSVLNILNIFTDLKDLNKNKVLYILYGHVFEMNCNEANVEFLKSNVYINV